jgi:hypothetical protein
VVYIACEGDRGLAARTEAFRQARLAEGARPAVLATYDAPRSCRRRDALIADTAAQFGPEGCVLIVIETLNRSIASSESNDADISAYVKAADKLRERFGGAVLVIHHCRIDDRRPRDHTSLSCAPMHRSPSDAIALTTY